MSTAVCQFSFIAEAFQSLKDPHDYSQGNTWTHGISDCVSIVLSFLDSYGFSKGKVSNYLSGLYKKVLI